MELPEATKRRYDGLLKSQGLDNAVQGLEQSERAILKAHAIQKAIKLQRYVRN